ncbi:LuxR family two component transcriptional regulator [Nocardiopsis sp. Huas11]|nr:LuxR family two component transcriptional regulator [Nocardiopsis sp. Huas11]
MHLLLIDNARLYAEPLARRLRGHPSTSDVTLCTPLELGDHVSRVPLLYDAALVNVSIPNAAELIRSLENVPLTAIALGVEETDQHLLRLAESGASGYVPLQGDVDDVIGNTEAAIRGELSCPPQITFSLWRRIGSIAADDPRERPTVHLTRREQEVLSLIALGASNQQIARELFIELRTVKNHVHNILRKLGVKRRGEAASRARELIGWSSVTPGDTRGRRARNPDRPGV